MGFQQLLSDGCCRCQHKVVEPIANVPSSVLQKFFPTAGPTACVHDPQESEECRVTNRSDQCHQHIIHLSVVWKGHGASK
jgi:hypothetical protein